MKPYAYYHDMGRGVYRVLVSSTGNRLDAEWVAVEPEAYWQMMKGAS